MAKKATESESASRLPADWLKDIDKQIAEEAEARAALRKSLVEKVLKTESRLVAWVDVLGFSEQVACASDPKAFRKVYLKLLRVHDYFSNPSASDDPVEQAKTNKAYGRTVTALSDGLVVTATLAAEARAMMTPYDLLMSFIGELIESQAHCALQGIFLRGGLSYGAFYFDQDILISPALVRAYKLETKVACYPIILISIKLVESLRGLKGRKHYAKDADPSLGYFKKFIPKDPSERNKYYFLDYLRYLIYSEQSWFKREDRLKYEGETNPTKKHQILNQSHAKTTARIVGWHKQALLDAYAAATDKRARAKYRWLMHYHNRALRGLLPVFNKVKIDMKALPLASRRSGQ